MMNQGGMLRRSSLAAALWGSVWCLLSLSAPADEPRFNAFTRDDQRATGKLTGDAPHSIRFVTSDGVALTLDRISSLDLPTIPRTLPDRGWKRASLVNGDVVHVKQRPQPVAPESKAGQNPAAAITWFTGFGETAELPLSAIATLSHPPATRCLTYQDFESDTTGWKTATGTALSPNREQGRSGTSSLKFSSTDRAGHYELPQPLRQGHVEFRFYIDPQSEPDGDCTAVFRFHTPQPLEVKVHLVGTERWYEVETPTNDIRTPQKISRRPGWHTIAMNWQSAEIQLTIDGFQLAEGRLTDGAPWELRDVGISSSLKSDGKSVCIDDFALVEPVARRHSRVTQRDSDQLDLVSGDQLFGKLSRIDAQSIVFTANTQTFPAPWSDVAEVRFADRRIAPHSVTGWIVRLDLQPWDVAPDIRDSDVLRGALQSVDRDACQLDHPLCGRLTIPWHAIRRLQPAYRGQEWVLEGHPRHLGNEVKSAFTVPTPEGSKLKWYLDLETIPSGEAYVALTAIDLEPSAPGTLPHRWLEQLRSGALTTELWANERRVAVLNQQVSRRGTPDQPRHLRVRLPPGSLTVGKNEVSLRLLPSTGALVEYDDWELRNLRIEVETKQ